MLNGRKHDLPAFLCMGCMAKKPHTPDLASNPKAKRDYHMVELFEAGIVLRVHGGEIPRAGRGEIKDAFARVEHGEVWLYNAHISKNIDLATGSTTILAPNANSC